MLSTTTRLQVEYICSRISNGAEVPLAEMTWIQKWASHNSSVYEMLRGARRKAQATDPLDHFLNDLGLGEPDPADHLHSGNTHPDRIAEWFHRNDGESLERLRRD